MTIPTNLTETAMQYHQSKKGSSPDIASIFSPNAFMTLLKNDRHNRVELHLRGEFTGPESNTQELAELYQLSEMYPTLLVYVNSIGGRVDTLTEIINVSKKFDVVITVCNGQASSAGFMIWCTGDIRVTDELAEHMFHREGWGMGGKTDQILDRAEFAKRHFERIVHEWCGDVVDEEQLEKARTTEVWISGHELIEQGKAISWEQFYQRDTTPLEMMTVANVNGRYYLNVGGNAAVPIDISVSSEEVVSIANEIYKGEPPEEKEEGSESTDINSMINTAILNLMGINDSESRDELRDILRDVYGKGNFQVKQDGSVKVKVDGEWKDMLDLLEQPGESNE